MRNVSNLVSLKNTVLKACDECEFWTETPVGTLSQCHSVLCVFFCVFLSLLFVICIWPDSEQCKNKKMSDIAIKKRDYTVHFHASVSGEQAVFSYLGR